jgi:prophage regulatory protein
VLHFAPLYEHHLNQSMKGLMEISKSEFRLLGERMRVFATLQRLENNHRDAVRGRYAPLTLKNESALIAGEAVSYNDDNTTKVEPRQNSRKRVEKSDDGDSDGDAEPDSRCSNHNTQETSPHGSDYGVLPAEGFVRLPKILEVLPVSRSTWWAGIKSGRFPAGIKFGTRTTVWRVEDIREVMLQLGGVK